VRRAAVVLLAGLCLLGLAGGASAITPPSGFIDTTVTDGLSAPTSMVWDASSARLFITEQGGDLLIVKDGALLSTPALHLTVDSSGERGLLGVELDPNFSSNHFLYLYYTVPGSPAHNRLSRFTVSGDTISAATEQVLLNLNSLSSATNHNGGGIHFGGDGKLYVGVGENANGANSQTLTTLLGKLLRINSDGSIPSDNPFFGTASGQNRLIYAMGLRNPFTFAFQPGTGRLFIDDVGQSTWEEIDDGIAGANYGWPTAEGVANPPNPAFTDPIFTYNHAAGTPAGNPGGCAITGGTFYNPPVAYFPSSYVGTYFFSDLCGGWIRNLDPAHGNAVSSFASGADSPIDLDTGPDGSLYYLEDGSRVGRISYQSTPTMTGFSPSSGAAGQKVTIDGTYLAGTTSVTFNGTPATFAVVWDTKLVVTVPAGATSGTIEVTTDGGTADSSSGFNVTSSPPAAPSISGFNPTSGPVGTSVTISGSSFTGATAVKFHGTNASSFTVDNDGQITAHVAAGTTSGTISVTAPGGTTTSAGSFTVVPPPVISSFSPTSGPPGTSVTINGSGLTGATAVSFHGTAAQTFTVNSSTKITAVVASGTTTGTISVTTPGGTTASAGSFTIPAAPTISSFSPTAGAVGTKIKIKGTGFTNAKNVLVGGTKTKFTVKSDTSIQATVQKGTKSGPITVSGPNGTVVSAGSFTVASGGKGK